MKIYVHVLVFKTSAVYVVLTEQLEFSGFHQFCSIAFYVQEMAIKDKELNLVIVNIGYFLFNVLYNLSVM